MLDRLRREESGAVMVIAAVALTTLLLFAGLALDFGRAHLLRAQLQTAVDAASLAGALQVIPMVSLEVDRWEEVAITEYDQYSGKPYVRYVQVQVPAAGAAGTEWDLIRRGGWRHAIAWQCRSPYICTDDYRIVRQWLVLPANTATVARETFHRNAVWPGGSGGAQLTGLDVGIDQGKVEVTTTARLQAPTTFLKLAGIPYLQIHRTGSAIPVRR